MGRRGDGGDEGDEGDGRRGVEPINYESNSFKTCFSHS